MTIKQHNWKKNLSNKIAGNILSRSHQPVTDHHSFENPKSWDSMTDVPKKIVAYRG